MLEDQRRSEFMFGEAFAMQDAGMPPPFFLAAFCRDSSERSFLALEFARNNGLSTVAGGLPWVSQVQVPTSPRKRPGRLLISIRKMPCGVNTSKSISLMLPSSPTNSKLAQAR